MQKIDISIIVPMYNSSKYLERTLNNLVELVEISKQNYQILLIDDGATDNTLMIAEKFADRYSYIEILRQKHKGVSVARNYGLNHAIGNYITFVDSDDVLNLQYWDKISYYFSQGYEIIITDRNEKYECRNMKIDDQILVWKSLNERRNGESPWSKFYRKDFIDAHNLRFTEEIIIGEDALFIYNALYFVKSICISKFPFYVQKETHTLGKFKKEMLDSELKFVKCLSELVNKYNGNERYKELVYIVNRYKCKEYFRLIQDYFVPLYRNKMISLEQAADKLRFIANKWNLTDALENNPYKKIDWYKRQKVYKNLLIAKNYKLVILIELLRKRIKHE